MVAVIDLAQIFERDSGADAGRWYYSIAYRLLRQLRLKTDLQAWWQDKSFLSNRQRLVEFYVEVILQNISERVVVFIDEVQYIEATAVDTFHWPRVRTAAAMCAGALLAGIVSMKSIDYILTSDLFWGSTMQPLGSALTLVGLAWIVKLRKTLDAVNEGNTGRPVGPLWYYWIKYVVPVGIIVILALGLDDLFGAFSG